jgi:hypothetical protein
VLQQRGSDRGVGQRPRLDIHDARADDGGGFDATCGDRVHDRSRYRDGERHRDLDRVTCNAITSLGDEFAAIAPFSAIRSDGMNAITGAGDCLGTVSTSHPDDAVWAACDSDSNVTATGPGDTKGADDGTGDWSEYKITTDPAGTVENVAFPNTSFYLLSMMTLTAQ